MVKSSYESCSLKKCVLRNFAKFTGKHLCQSLFFDKVADLRPATLLKKRLWHRCFPVNFVKFLRTHFLETTSGRLLLIGEISKLQNLLEKLWNPPEVTRIRVNLEHDAITVLNLVRNWSISTQISDSYRNLAKWGTRYFCSNECWIRARWIIDKNNNV